MNWTTKKLEQGNEEIFPAETKPQCHRSPVKSIRNIDMGQDDPQESEKIV